MNGDNTAFDIIHLGLSPKHHTKDDVYVFPALIKKERSRYAWKLSEATTTCVGCHVQCKNKYGRQIIASGSFPAMQFEADAILVEELWDGGMKVLPKQNNQLVISHNCMEALHG